MFSINQKCWFMRKVVRWRSIASIAWSVLLLPPIFITTVFLIRLSVLHPVRWLSECVGVLSAPSSAFCVVLLCSSTFLLGFFNLQYYSVVPSIPCSRVSLLAEVLHPARCVYSLVHVAVAMLLVWCVSVMAGGRYRALRSPCTRDHSGGAEACLNEHHLFLLLAGAFAGYTHSLMGVVHNVHYVSFQIIQQYKYMRFKGSLASLVKCSAVQSLYSSRNFLLLYFLFGHIPRTWMSSTLNLPIDSRVSALDSMAGLCDLSLLYELWVSGTFLLLTWNTSVLLFRIYVTEPYRFPVQSLFAEEAEQGLPKALMDSSSPVMKFLALQDLALLSQHSPSRRQEVFSLSQPGGHPHNWNAVSKECVSLLRDLTRRLVTHQDAVATSNGRVRPPSDRSDPRSGSSLGSVSGMEDLLQTPRPSALIRTPASVFGPTHGVMTPPLTAPFTPELTDPFSGPAPHTLLEVQRPWSVQSPHVTRRNPKLWSTSTDSHSNGSPSPTPVRGPASPPPDQKPSLLSQWLQNRKEQVKAFLSKRVLVMYLFNKLPEASSQALFADCQAHIWALEGLSYLVAASFTEDKFGVVQTTLPSILDSMLSLQEAVDRHFKLPHASSKPVRSPASFGDSSYRTLRFALRATLKTAIYRITSTFGEHLNAVVVSPEHQKRLQQFLEFKE